MERQPSTRRISGVRHENVQNSAEIMLRPAYRGAREVGDAAYPYPRPVVTVAVVKPSGFRRTAKAPEQPITGALNPRPVAPGKRRNGGR